MPRWTVLLFVILLPLQLAWSSMSHLCVDSHEASAVHVTQHAGADAGTDQDADDPCAALGGHCHGHLTALPMSVHVVATSIPRFEIGAPAPGPVSSRPSPRPDRPQWQALA